MADVLLPDGSVYRYDDDSGTWRHVPDVDTANAMGVDFAALEQDDSLPGPQGPDWPSVDGSPSPPPSAPASQPPASTGPPTGADVIDPAGNVYRFDPSLGAWRHIPDVATAGAMGVDWNALAATDGAPQPLGIDFPSVTQAAPPPPPPAPIPALPASAPGPAASAPPPSFQWGGQAWQAGDLASFVGYLAAHGTDFSVWAVNHPDAAAILTGPPTDPSREAVPKSIGEALGAYIVSGATPEQAADAVSGLAASQAAQGFGAPQGAALLAAAQDVAAAYAAAGGVPASHASGGVTASVTPDDASRSLLGIGSVTLGAVDASAPAGITTAWKQLVDFFKTTVPQQRTAVESKGHDLKRIFT